MVRRVACVLRVDCSTWSSTFIPSFHTYCSRLHAPTPHTCLPSRQLTQLLPTIDYTAFKSALIPRVHTLCLATTSASVRAHAMLLLARQVFSTFWPQHQPLNREDEQMVMQGLGSQGLGRGRCRSVGVFTCGQTLCLTRTSASVKSARHAALGKASVFRNSQHRELVCRGVGFDSRLGTPCCAWQGSREKEDIKRRERSLIYAWACHAVPASKYLLLMRRCCKGAWALKKCGVWFTHGQRTSSSRRDGHTTALATPLSPL